MDPKTVRKLLAELHELRFIFIDTSFVPGVAGNHIDINWQKPDLNAKAKVEADGFASELSFEERLDGRRKAREAWFGNAEVTIPCTMGNQPPKTSITRTEGNGVEVAGNPERNHSIFPTNNQETTKEQSTNNQPADCCAISEAEHRCDEDELNEGSDETEQHSGPLPASNTPTTDDADSAECRDNDDSKGDSCPTDVSQDDIEDVPATLRSIWGPDTAAVLEVCGIVPEEMTSKAIGALRAAMKDLRSLDEPPGPAEIESRAAAYRSRYRSASLTPSALAKHWPQLGSSSNSPHQPGGRISEYFDESDF